MDEKEFISSVLGFSEPWYIVGMRQVEDVIEIKLDYAGGTKFRCQICGKFCTVYDSKWRKYRHLDLWQYKTILNVHIPRIKCDCNCKRTTIQLPWTRSGSSFTQMMEMHILEMAKNGSISKQAKLLRITDTRMWRVIIYHTERCRKKADFSSVTSLGIDETSKKGHNYLTNFVDLVKRKIMFIADGKDSGTVGAFSKDFVLHGGVKSRIINTTSDMSLAFECGIRREFENSKIVIDKFHVVKYFNDALNKTLRDDVKAGLDLKNTRYLWLMNRENLSEKQLKRFDCVSKRNCMTVRAYGMKLAMQEIYRLTDKEEAKGELRRLVGWLCRSRNVHMKKLAGTVVSHFENILNYFDDRLTNAVLEGLNNIVQSIKHTARGFRNCEYMKAICYLHCGAFEVTAL